MSPTNRPFIDQNAKSGKKKLEVIPKPNPVKNFQYGLAGEKHIQIRIPGIKTIYILNSHARILAEWILTNVRKEG